MKIIETHTHTANVSYCSRIEPQVLPHLLKDAGVDTFLVTNHYARSQMSAYAKKIDEQLLKYLAEYREVKEAADSIRVCAMLGAEVAISTKASPYTEFILFGVTEKFLLNSPALYDLSQKKLYSLCNDSGVLMYQAHPFRSEQGHSPADPEYMDGVEINLHMNFLHKADEVYAFADKYSLGVSCGSDIHYASQAGAGGIYADEDLNDSVELAAFLKKHKRPKIYIR